MRTGPEFGHIYDHMSVVYEYQNGVKAFSLCRQQPGAFNEVKDFVWGTRGKCDVMRHDITGATTWRFGAAAARQVDMYQQEHIELFQSIRRSQPINNGEFMAKSTLMAIMGRMACYTGQAVTWDQALNSQVNLVPENLTWETAMPVPEVARPGITRL